MSDHVDGDGPALARDAAGNVRLTDGQAAALAGEWAKGATVRVRIGGSRAYQQDVAELKALVRYVLAVAPVVAAARVLCAAELAVDEHRRTVSPWLDKSMSEINPAWGQEQARLRDAADARRAALDAALAALDGDA